MNEYACPPDLGHPFMFKPGDIAYAKVNTNIVRKFVVCICNLRLSKFGMDYFYEDENQEIYAEEDVYKTAEAAFSS